MTSETKEGSGVLKGLPLETWHLKSPEPTFWFGSRVPILLERGLEYYG